MTIETWIDCSLGNCHRVSLEYKRSSRCAWTGLETLLKPCVVNAFSSSSFHEHLCSSCIRCTKWRRSWWPCWQAGFGTSWTCELSHTVLNWEATTGWNSTGSVRRRWCSDLHLKVFQKSLWSWKIKILCATYYQLLILGIFWVCMVRKWKYSSAVIQMEALEVQLLSTAIDPHLSTPSVTWSLIVFSWQCCFDHRCVENWGGLTPRYWCIVSFFPSSPLCWERCSSSIGNGTGELICLENDCNTLSFPPAQKRSAQSDLLSSSSPALQTSVAARVHNTVWTETL